MIPPERKLPIRAIVPILLLAALVDAGCVSRKITTTSPTGDFRIVSVTADPDTVPLYGQAVITCAVDNPSGSALSYSWNAYRGSIVGQGATARYFGSYCCAGTDWVLVTVRDNLGAADTHLLTMTVLLN